MPMGVYPASDTHASESCRLHQVITANKCPLVGAFKTKLQCVRLAEYSAPSEKNKEAVLVHVQTEVQGELLNKIAEGQPVHGAGWEEVHLYPGPCSKSPWRVKQEAASSDWGRALEWRTGCE